MPHCPICNSAKIRLILPRTSSVDNSLTDSYQVYTCEECSAGITFPLPSKENLTIEYETGVYKKSGGHAYWLIDRLLNVLHDHRLKELDRFRCPPGSLLDVGSGKGRFVSRATQHGWAAQGVEPSPGQVIAARSRYAIEVFEGELQEAGFAPQSFDVVTAWHVLEHVANPHAVVEEIRRILRPNGLMVFEVPNFYSWQARLGREYWFHLDIPRHLIHYSPFTLQQLLIQHRLKIIYQQTFSFESGPLGMLESMLNRLGLSPNWLYRWLKHSTSANPGLLGLNIAIGTLASGPALFLETLASMVHSGGIVRAIAVAI